MILYYAISFILFFTNNKHLFPIFLGAEVKGHGAGKFLFTKGLLPLSNPIYYFKPKVCAFCVLKYNQKIWHSLIYQSVYKLNNKVYNIYTCSIV